MFFEDYRFSLIERQRNEYLFRLYLCCLWIDLVVLYGFEFDDSRLWWLEQGKSWPFVIIKFFKWNLLISYLFTQENSSFSFIELYWRWQVNGKNWCFHFLWVLITETPMPSPILFCYLKNMWGCFSPFLVLSALNLWSYSTQYKLT